MSHKRKNLLEDIPEKKKLSKIVEFNLDEYIKKKINTDNLKFTEKCKKEFSLLDKLTSGFLSYLKKDNNMPYEFSCMGSPYDLSKLQEKAIEVFTFQIEKKGYNIEIHQESTSRYCSYRITVQ